MTIDSTTVRESFAVNAPQVYIYVIENSGLESIVVFEVGSDSVYTEVTNYNNVLNGTGPPLWDGGTITFTSPHLGNTVRIEVWRRTDVDQLIDYQAYDSFPAETHEFGLDKITMILQEHGLLIVSNIERIQALEDGGGGGGGGGAFIPLAGTEIGFPVTGPISFSNSQASLVYTMRSDVFGPNSYGFLTENNGTSFIIATRDDGGVVQGFAFTEDGQFSIPSNSGDNQEAWQFAAGSFGGDDDILIIAPVDALGNIRTHSATIFTSPTNQWVFNSLGYLEASRNTVVGDPDNSLVTKAYAEALVPGGGGEVNIQTSPAVTGVELEMAKVGFDLQIKTLVAGTSMVITDNGDSLLLDAGGGLGLPAGDLNQSLRNDAGTNTYVATSGVLIDAAGNVAVGPGAVDPVVPLQVHGQITVLDGALIALNNPANTSTGSLQTPASNRTTLQGGAGGAVDIIGDTSTGAAVKLIANGQDVYIANGTVASWASILHGGVQRFRTTDSGVTQYGHLRVRDLNDTVLHFEVDAAGAGHFAGDMDAIGQCVAASFTAYIGNITANQQVIANEPNPTQPEHLTRKDYVDSKLSGKANATHNHDGTYVKLTGDTMTGTLTVEGALIGAIAGFSGDVSSSGTISSFAMETTVGNIASASHVIIGAVNPQLNGHATHKLYVDTAVSDIRLKRKIDGLPSVLGAVNLLETFTFEYEEGAVRKRAYHERRYGLSAQELQIDFPHAVHHLASDRDDEGNSISGDHLLGVDYAELVPVLIKAIQELTARVAELEK